MEHDGGQCEKKNIYIYMCVYNLVTAVQKKMTEHCKPTITNKQKNLYRDAKKKNTKPTLAKYIKIIRN